MKDAMLRAVPNEMGENHAASRWAAVVRGDSSAAFVYCVKTTGVYCKPSCGARLPKRENVVFHDSCADAEKAGFRPCKRCSPGKISLEQQHEEIAARACRLIESGDHSSDLKSLASTFGLSPFHFQRLFKKIVGMTPKNYAAARQAESAQGQSEGASESSEGCKAKGAGAG